MHEVQIKTEALGFHCFAALSLQETTLNFFFFFLSTIWWWYMMMN